MLYISKARASYIVSYEAIEQKEFYSNMIEGGIITETDKKQEIEEKLEEMLEEKYLYQDHKFNQGEFPEIIFAKIEILKTRETYHDFLEPETPSKDDSTKISHLKIVKSNNRRTKKKT